MELVAANDQRVAFVGQTEMGKSFLAEHLLAQQPRVIAIDSKPGLNWPGYHLTDNPVAALLTDKVIYRPPGGTPPESFWMEAVRSLHDRGGGIIYVDEGPVVMTPNRIPKGLADAIRVGAQLGVGVWVSSQESVTVHNTTLRQAKLIVLFYIQGHSDRDKLSKIVGDMAHTTAYLKPYEFVVFVRGETYDHDAVPKYMAVA